ncbi:ATP-binding protein, partial [Streptomyces sp. JJ36]|nr:ATP-binding protein [Streptomyces sp. JJ36]
AGPPPPQSRPQPPAAPGGLPPQQPQPAHAGGGPGQARQTPAPHPPQAPAPHPPQNPVAHPPQPAAEAAGPGAGPPPAAQGERPQLPKRRRQEHLVPELRQPPARFGGGTPEGADDADTGHNPGLMAAFRRGTTLADQNDGTDETTHAAGGETPRPAR